MHDNSNTGVLSMYISIVSEVSSINNDSAEMALNNPFVKKKK